MPTIYLSPSTQDWNLYIDGGTEEYYMNLIADAMIPYLRASGIGYVRNTPEMTAASSIRQSNQGNYDLHLALHSNAAPENRSGFVQGSEVYYSPNSVQGKRAAEIFAQNLKAIYPDPNKVKTVPTTSLGEVHRTKAPAILLEFAYHDNSTDAQWIRDNIQAIARNTVLSLTEYFGIPFVEPQGEFTGVVVTDGSNLNIRSRPSIENSRVLARAPEGATLLVTGRYDNWYVVHYNGTIGYASARYIRPA